MAIRDILSKLKTEEPTAGTDYIELEHEEELRDGKLSIEIEKMEDFSDSERVQKKIREGKVLLIKIKELRNKDMEGLKKAISKIKKTSMALDGEITGVGDDWLLATPANAHLQREHAE